MSPEKRVLPRKWGIVLAGPDAGRVKLGREGNKPQTQEARLRRIPQSNYQISLNTV